jgi:hypothetical protein
MPMDVPELHGTDIDGTVSSDYCCYCFLEGEFTFTLSREAFIEMQVRVAIEQLAMDERQARAMAAAVIPQLKRWRR